MSSLTASFSFSLKCRLRQAIRFYTQCKDRQGREKKKSKKRKKPQGLWDDDRKNIKRVFPPLVRDMKAPGTTFIDKGSDPYH